MSTTETELDAARERMNALYVESDKALEASRNGAAELARLSLLKLAEDMPGITGMSYEVNYEYDDEGGYFPCSTVYALKEGGGSFEDFDDEFSDAMSGFGHDVLATLCGVDTDAMQGEITLTEARERRF